MEKIRRLWKNVMACLMFDITQLVIYVLYGIE